MTTPAATTFAVVVTSYNYCAFVEEAVDAALAQTRPAAQVVVVDDGSSDGSIELLRARYGDDPRVELVFGENGGQLVAFRRGLERVRSDVVCFLDADDRWEPGYLAALGAAFDARRDVDFVFSDILLFGDEARPIAFADHEVDLGYTAIATFVLGHWYGAPTSALALRTPWARRCLDLGDDAATRWRLSADNCLVFGASILGARKLFLPTGKVGYRIHGSNGWWSHRGPITNYRNRLTSRALINEYARRAGIDAMSIPLAKSEFRTKPSPDWAEARRYAEVAMHGPQPLWLRMERALGIIAAPLKRRRVR